tara:strand:- start:126 stop:1280 length:1155 start_codon:yes stop_codon:yes gene_type:complete
MSLFERIKNKRYNLQEAPIDDKGNITPEPGEVKKSEKILKKFIKKQKKEENKNIKTNQQQGDKLLQDINKRKSADLTRADAINRSMGTSGSTEGAGGANTGTTPPKPKITGDVVTNKGVNQADVSKQAQEFTKKVNKERIVKQGNIFGGEDEVKPKRRVGSTKSRGTRTKTKTPAVSGQQKLNLGGDVTKKTPTPRLSKSGEVVTDLRTTGRKPRKVRKRRVDAKPPKPEKMVTVKDPVKGGFKEVGATTTQGRKVLRTKQFASTKELLDPTPKPKPSTTKPNLFTRIKNFVKGEPKIPGDYKLLRGTADQPLSVTRKVYKGKLGAVRKFVDKLPRKYKLAGTALLATAAAVPTIKKAFAPKPEKKSYTVANKTLKLDTGKKNT